ncbi:MAG: sugar-binding transcriptional regulator [Anaerolineae bacterium]|nr:sugar-binding transcriptional regulator [Anaerolineae bacterium]
MVNLRQLEELRLLARVADLYHVRGLNQKEIAERLALSQATISRLLKRAVAEGIVRITVSMPPGVHTALETALRDHYNLLDAIVVDTETDDEASLQHGLGAAAAFYLENTIKKNDIIGISSWSATLLRMVAAMNPLARSLDVRVVQILGGVGRADAEVHATYLTDRLAKLVLGTASFLTAPGVLASADARAVLSSDPYVAETLALFDQITLALVGIGSLQPSELLASSGNIFSEQELDDLRAGGGVGDVCLRFFDINGKPVLTPLNDRVMGMALPQLKHVPRTVGIAGGQRKHAAIQGALRGGWINVLITDRVTADYLIEHAR